jgi:hypothetical protein
VTLTNSCPENTVFHFEGFNKFNDKEVLIKLLKQKAASAGTTLVNHSTYNNTFATDPTHQTVITCKHYGILKNSIYKQHTFKANTLQAAGTLIEPKHSGASTKGNSCNRKMKRVISETSQHSKNKVNRCHTTRCACCFKFTISFHLKSSRWFLLKKHAKNSLPIHTNHIWIDPFHEYQGTWNLNQQVKRVIMDLVLSGVAISNITIYIRIKFKINVEYNNR